MVEKKSLVPSLAHKVFQKRLRNLASLSDTMILGKPWSLIISPKKSFEMWETSSTLCHGIKCAIFLNLSTTTKIESTRLWVQGSPRTKSILMSTEGANGMSKGVYSL